MPRLGAEPSVAPAYPDRGRPNLRGGWLRQMTNTLLGTLLLLFIMNNVVRKNYKDDTKNYMKAQGVDEKKIDQLIPKTATELRRDKELAKKTSEQKMLFLMNEIANLTKAVVELQEVLVQQTGKMLVHRIDVPPAEEKKEKSGETAAEGVATGNGTGGVNAEDAGANGGGGADAGGVNLAVGLRGADRESGNAEKSGGSQDTGGNGEREGPAGRRLRVNHSMWGLGRRRDLSGRKAPRPKAKASH